MPAPTLVATYASTYTSTNVDATASITNSTDDVLVCCAMTEDGNNVFSTPTGGTGLTWTLRQSYAITSHTGLYLWTAQATAGNTAQTLTCARDGSTFFGGFVVARFSGSSGVGNSAKQQLSTGAPQVAVTASQANSAMVAGIGDWNAVDGATRTWATINSITPASGSGELTYQRNAASATYYAACWSDVGATGSKTTGLSVPNSGMAWSIVAVEILGTAGSGGAVPEIVIAPSIAAHQAASW